MPGSPTRVLHDHLLEALAATPRRPVIRALPGTPVGVGPFLKRVAAAARRLERAGRGPRSIAGSPPEEGTMVLLSVRNLDSYPVALAALWERGLVPLLADADLNGPELTALARAFRPAACLLDRPAVLPGGRLEAFGPSLPGLRLWTPVRGGARRAGPARALAGAAIVRLSSGSTGRPRGIAVTAPQLLADSRQICATMGIQPDDTMVAAIPLGHAYGFVHVLMSLFLQGTRPLLLERPLPALLDRALSGPGPLVMAGTPYLFSLLMQSAAAGRYRGLRLCVSAGAPLPGRLSRAFKRKFGLPIRTFYGASECGGICFDRSRAGVLPDGCVGTPLAGVDLTLETAPGEEGLGRICVRSEAVALGRFPDGPDEDLRPGLFRTSDLGRIDEAGRVHLAGRIDSAINVGGRKVLPAEVEAVIRDHAGVRQAVVFGAPDRHRGQIVCALVVAAKGVRRETILGACRDRLTPFKVPRRLEFVPSIPCTPRGKTDRRALARLIGLPATP